MHDETRILSIGHSNHELPRFLDLLAESGVQAIADVRSQPFSRFSPQFNRRELRAALLDHGLAYAFLGDELGGRPPEEELYDGAGHVMYGAVAETERFQAGLSRLLEGAEQYRIALLCSEEDPTNCHRRLLVTRVLTDREVPVVHIRGNGAMEPESVVAARLERPCQSSLFGEEPAAWISTRSVSRSTPLRSSSAS